MTPDPAPLEGCPDRFPIAPSLPPLAPFALPDGRAAVLLETLIARETVTARFIIEGRQAWYECRSAVVYVEDWSALISHASKVAR